MSGSPKFITISPATLTTSPAAAAGGGGLPVISMDASYADKRNRNPNWTDQEIVRFLEILQEEDTMKDLMAQRNKQVFCYVAQRMCAEGADKTWDQCRVKLKNLKSQYRYVKDRIPNLDSLDLEDEAVVKKLIQDCQGRGISSSSIKHLKYLRRFVHKQNIMSINSGGDSGSENGAPPGNINNEHSDMEEPVSPPTTPVNKENGNIRLIPEKSLTNPASSNNGGTRSRKRKAEDSIRREIQDGFTFIERFNRDMMEQFMEQQRKSQGNFLRWEQERFRMEQAAMERWRQEARDHEKQLFGMFCHVMTQCNTALNTILKAAQAATNADTEDNQDE